LTQQEVNQKAIFQEQCVWLTCTYDHEIAVKRSAKTLWHPLLQGNTRCECATIEKVAQNHGQPVPCY